MGLLEEPCKRLSRSVCWRRGEARPAAANCWVAVGLQGWPAGVAEQLQAPAFGCCWPQGTWYVTCASGQPWLLQWVSFVYHLFGLSIGCQSASSHIWALLMLRKYLYLFLGFVQHFFLTCSRYAGHVWLDAQCAVFLPVFPACVQLMHLGSLFLHLLVQCKPRHHLHWTGFLQVFAQ
jgi:hypothetical protein